MLVGSTNQVFFKAFTLSVPVGVHGCNMLSGALILLFGQQTVYQFVRLFLFSFLSNGNKIANLLDS